MDTNENNEIKIRGIVNANCGPGMSVAYSLLCIPFFVNAMGWGNTAGFAFSMGLIQLGYFILYLVFSVNFLKIGNQISGGIYQVFAAAFGLFGGLGNLSAALCPRFGIEYDPSMVSVCFLFSGLYLLFILPTVAGSTFLDWFGLLGAGIGVTAFGLAGFGILPAILSKVGGIGILISGLANFYCGIAGHLAVVGIDLPCGKPIKKQ